MAKKKKIKVSIPWNSDKHETRRYRISLVYYVYISAD